MKARILTIIISFIFLFSIYSNTIYAITNEIVNKDEIIEETEEDQNEVIDTNDVVETEENLSDENEAEEENTEENEKAEVQKIDENTEEIDKTEDTENLSTEEIQTECENQESQEVQNDESEEKDGIVDDTEKIEIVMNETENVEATSYKGTMYIDTPTNNKSFTRPDTTTLNIQGWAVSNDSSATVRIFVDGNVSVSSATRTSRADVDKLVSPLYGGTSTTPKAGFTASLNISSWSTGSHTIKVVELSRTGGTIAATQITVKVVNRTYSGTMCIDTPTSNKTITRPDSTTLSIQGWAVSTDSSATVKIYVDGSVVVSSATRSSRADVNKLVSPQYGGTTNTPKAGFTASLDISNWTTGSHTIKVVELSRFGATIASSQVTVKIANRTYSGTMCIDTPQNTQSFTRPTDAEITVAGWAVSNDSKATVKIYVDGSVVVSSATRSSRADVNKAVSPQYGGTTTTPKAGFSATIDIFEMTSGKHIIKVEEVSNLGTVIASSQITINLLYRSYVGTMCIDAPTSNISVTRPDTTKLTVEGWAVSNDVSAIVKIYLDGNVVISKATRVKRTDVDSLISSAYGGTTRTPKAGFSGTIDISSLGAGSHTIKVEQISGYGDIISSLETTFKVVNKTYSGTMCIDTPTSNKSFTRPDDTKISVEGWTVSNDSGATVRIYLDGNVVVSSATRVKRTDVDSSVSPKYGGTTTTPKAGFAANLDISSLGAGSHTIKVQQLSRYGDVISSQETAFNIVNKKYSGTVYIDTPTYCQSFTRPDTTQISLKGWAVSTDSGATVRTYLDGSVVISSVTRTSRSDIDLLISPQYGGTSNTPKAGYEGTLNISSLSSGSHKIKIEVLSRYGDVITYCETTINIVNKTYYGEMCVDTPTAGKIYTKGDSIAVTGWAVSTDSNATVEIYVDSTSFGTAQRYTRSDVAYYVNKYGDQTLNAGYSKSISTSTITVGTHTITVYEKSRYGDIIGGVSVQIIIQSSSSSNTTNTTPTYNTSGTKGIDVSQFQGTIDWSSVANSGIKYAMIRIGYRGYGTGGLAEDSKFAYNFKNAVANGLKVGVYFYSAAISSAEAKQDAEYVMSLLQKYGYQNQVSMPIALDLELVSGVNTRDKNVSKSVRTSIANTFCSQIASYGYTPMVYACKSFLNSNLYASQISYDIWVAQYNSSCTYSGSYTMWQYSSSGSVSGISGNVDCNICYKNY